MIAKKIPLQSTATVLLMLLTACASDTPSAPPMSFHEEASSDYARANIRQDKVLVINGNMGLNTTDPNYDKFWHEYYPYETQLKKLTDERIKLLRDYSYNYNQVDDKAADNFAERFFDLKSRRLELLREYYARMKKATSPSIAARFVQIENEINNLIDAELNAQVPLIPKDKY